MWTGPRELVAPRLQSRDSVNGTYGAAGSRALSKRDIRCAFFGNRLGRLEHFDRFHQALPHTIKRVVQFGDFVLPFNVKFGDI